MIFCIVVIPAHVLNFLVFFSYVIFFFLLVISPLKIVLQTEKMELEATVVDETKERDSYCGQGNRRYSGLFCFFNFFNGNNLFHPFFLEYKLTMSIIHM